MLLNPTFSSTMWHLTSTVQTAPLNRFTNMIMYIQILAHTSRRTQLTNFAKRGKKYLLALSLLANPSHTAGPSCTQAHAWGGAKKPGGRGD